MINRVSIVGISGSGKSVFSRKLAEQTGLPLFHMDQLFWRKNWQEVPEDEYLIQHRELINKDKWIIEGYIDEKMADRLRRSDLIIFLDYPGWLCAWQVFIRWLRHRNNPRPELPKEALEKLEGEFLWRVFTRKERIPLTQALNMAKDVKLIVIPSPRELKILMQNTASL